MDRQNQPKWRRAVALTALLAVSGALAVRADQHAALWNQNAQAFDQSAYLHFAQKMRRSHFTYWTDGARGPAFPFLLALVYQRGMTDEAHFAIARRLGIALSLAALAALAALLWRWLPRHSALNILWISTFSVFLFRAPYVQPEPLYYVAFFVAYVQACRLLQAPGIRAGLLAGTALGVAQLLKPAVLPALGLLLVLVLLDGLVGVWRRSRCRKQPRELAGQPSGFRDQRLGQPDGDAGKPQAPSGCWAVWAVLSTAVAFLSVTAPWWISNIRTFGHPFYNVNTTFYMWYDSWDEVKAGTRAHGDRIGWPTIPAEDLPGPARYVRDHTAQDIWHRLAAGSRRLLDDARGPHGFGRYAILYAAVCGAIALRERRRLLTHLRRAPTVVLFVGGFFVLYLSGFAWFGPVNYGERLLQSLFLPWLYTCSVVGHRLTVSRVLQVRGRSMALSGCLEAAVSALAIPDGAIAFGWRILRLSGGA